MKYYAIFESPVLGEFNVHTPNGMVKAYPLPEPIELNEEQKYQLEQMAKVIYKDDWKQAVAEMDLVNQGYNRCLADLEIAYEEPSLIVENFLESKKEK